MRVLAKELDIQAPSLYWHFANKQSLLEAIADELLRDVARKVSPTASWDSVIEKVAQEFRAALAKHRDGARVFGGIYATTENVVRSGETMIATLRRAGASPEVAAWGWLSISYFVIGFVIEEQDLNQKGGRATVDLEAAQRGLQNFAPARIPAMLEAMPALLSQNFDRRFDFGLHLVLEGLRHEIGKKQAARGKRASQR